MAHEIYDFAESEKIRRLYYGTPNWYDLHCNTSQAYLHPGFIRISDKEHIHIHRLFDAINKNGVELA